MTEDELIDIISNVTTLLGASLAQYIELNESIAGAGVESQTLKLDALKARMAIEKSRLTKLKDAAKRKRELERLRQRHQTQDSRNSTNEGKATNSRVALMNGKGRWIGWVEKQANGNVNIYDARGRIVARELGGLTIDGSGKLFARGRAGLVALGASLQTRR